MTRLLVVDDDRELCELMSEFLSREGYEVDAVHDGQQGLELALAGEHALLVLDVMLPGLSGFELLRRLRESSPVPVIMLTARGEDVDRIVGLEMGADDYMPKPFNPRELTARIRAVLRRAETAEAADTEAEDSLVEGDLRVDPGARTVQLAGRELELTGVEFSILEVLLRNAGRVVSREELSQLALSRRPSPTDRSLDVHVSNLRRKLGAPAGGRDRIKTVRGVGYLYVRPSG